MPEAEPKPPKPRLPPVNPNADPVLTEKAYAYWAGQGRIGTNEILTNDQLEEICELIASGTVRAVGAFAQVMGIGPNAVSSLRGEGRSVADLINNAHAAGRKPPALNPRQVRALYIMHRLYKAEGRREQELTSLALGLIDDRGPNAQATMILNATVYAAEANSMTRVEHLAEQQQESAAEPTPAQRRAWLAREAAALGVALVPKADPQT